MTLDPRACACIVITAALLVAADARAGTRAADVVCRGGPCAAPALRGVIAEVMAAEDVALSWTVSDDARPTDLLRPAPFAIAGSAPVRALVDLSRPIHARVALVAPGGERFVLREIPLPQGMDEVGRETLAYLLRRAVRLLVDEQQAALSRAEAEAALRSQEVEAVVAEPRVTPVVATPAPPPRRGAIDASVGWTGRAIGDGPHLAHGPRLALALAWARAVAQIEVVALQASEWEAPPVGARLRSVGARMGGGVVLHAGTWSCRALAGAGADVTRVEPRASDAAVDVELAAASTFVELVVGASVVVDVPLSGRLGLFLATGVEARLPRRRLEIERASGRETVARTWPVEPWLGGGVTWR